MWYTRPGNFKKVYMQVLVMLLSFLVGGFSYASSSDAISIIDAPMVASEDAPKTEEERISACESNIQTLTGRVEVLEHAIKELQNSKSSHDLTKNQDTQSAENEKKDVSLLDHNSDEKKEYDAALAALKESRFEDAEKLFAAFMQKHTNSDLMGNAYFWYAETFYRRGEFDQAAVHYLKGYKQYPKSSKAADNLLKLALSLGELHKNKDACSMLNKLDAEYKNRPSASVKRASDARAKYCK